MLYANKNSSELEFKKMCMNVINTCANEMWYPFNMYLDEGHVIVKILRTGI